MFNPVFHGPLLILSFFLKSYFLAVDGKILKSMTVLIPFILGARTDCGSKREHTLVFRCFHSVTFMAAFIDFSRLIGLFLNAVYCSLNNIFPCYLLSDISVEYSVKSSFNSASAFRLISNDIFI